VATVLTAIGYALLLGACFSQMRSVGWRTGLGLGVAGFVVFQLAPALGLPPQPPGAPVAELAPRQLWWLGTVVATALALGAWFYARNHSKLIWIPVGVVLLLLPHVIGAPQATEGQSLVPQELARSFAIAALTTAAVFWLVLGSIEGYLFDKWGQRQ
jgi:cobalt transporter subunit CbtA